MNYVLDTHVWIAIFGSKKFDRFLDCILDLNISIFTCSEQEKEFSDVHNKHAKVAKMLALPTDAYINAIQLCTGEISLGKTYRLLSDYKDNYLIDLSHSTASILVSDDKGFAIAKKLRSPDVKIISLREFYKLCRL